MPLLLAIEPDPRQAARVMALARTHLEAEMTVVSTIDEALAALERRTPDLVLTPLLLSAKDDALLTARLRELCVDGTQVQTLVTPVLAASDAVPEPARTGGLLTRLRTRRASGAGTDGCAPSVFAAQIGEYLARSANERHDREALGRDDYWAEALAAAEVVAPDRRSHDAPVAETVEAFVASGFSRTVEAPVAAGLSRIDGSPEREPGEPPQSVASEAHVETEWQVTVEADRADEPVIDAEWLDLAQDLEALRTPSTEPAASATPLIVEAEPEPDVFELPPADELWAQLTPGYARLMAPLEGPSMAKPRPRAPRVPRPPKAVRAKRAEAGAGVPRRPRPRTAPDRPMQDEWGLYDPEQCGFAALLTRLEELADDDRGDPGRGSPSAIMRR